MARSVKQAYFFLQLHLRHVSCCLFWFLCRSLAFNSLFKDLHVHCKSVLNTENRCRMGYTGSYNFHTIDTVFEQRQLAVLGGNGIWRQ